MTDTTEDLELFDDAKEAFPAKEDLKDRLVLIWATGKTGQRKSETTGKAYDWAETVTMVIDDGPNGWNPVRSDGEPSLVPAVATDGPQVLDGFQWSAGGLVSRIKQRIGTDGKPSTFKPFLGRINERKNKNKGMANSWSISEPTDADKVTARKFGVQIKAVMDKLSKPPVVSEDDAFE
jgi:hypothetical protein